MYFKIRILYSKVITSCTSLDWVSVNWEHLSDKLITVLNKDVQGNIMVSHVCQLQSSIKMSKVTCWLLTSGFSARWWRSHAGETSCWWHILVHGRALFFPSQSSVLGTCKETSHGKLCFKKLITSRVVPNNHSLIATIVLKLRMIKLFWRIASSNATTTPDGMQ